jgi:hypothetical protein
MLFMISVRTSQGTYDVAATDPKPVNGFQGGNHTKDSAVSGINRVL